MHLGVTVLSTDHNLWGLKDLAIGSAPKELITKSLSDENVWLVGSLLILLGCGEVFEVGSQCWS